MLGLHFCARAFSSCGKRGPLFIAVCGPLTVAASLVVEHRLQTCRLSSCGSRAQLLRGMWDPPRPGLEPVSPALAGRPSTTAPPGKPYKFYFYWHIYYFQCFSFLCTDLSFYLASFSFYPKSFLNISGSASMLALAYSRFCSSEDVFILPSVSLKGIFLLDIEFWVDLCPQNFKDV